MNICFTAGTSLNYKYTEIMNMNIIITIKNSQYVSLY